MAVSLFQNMGCLNKPYYYFSLLKALEIKLRGFLFVRKETHMNIDYTKLNERIIEQAVLAAKSHYDLSAEQKAELLQGKFNRARAMLQARDRTKIDNIGKV
jgi:hypothetical protein